MEFSTMENASRPQENVSNLSKGFQTICHKESENVDLYYIYRCSLFYLFGFCAGVVLFSCGYGSSLLRWVDLAEGDHC